MTVQMEGVIAPRIDPDYRLPCDVKVAPATTICKGVPLSTLMLAIKRREGWDEASTRFPSRGALHWSRGRSGDAESSGNFFDGDKCPSCGAESFNRTKELCEEYALATDETVRAASKLCRPAEGVCRGGSCMACPKAAQHEADVRADERAKCFQEVEAFAREYVERRCMPGDEDLNSHVKAQGWAILLAASAIKGPKEQAYG